MLLSLRNRHFLVLDTLVFAITPTLALALRLDGAIDFGRYGLNLLLITPLFVVIKLCVLSRFGFYRNYWRSASVAELTQITMMMVAAVIVQILVCFAVFETGLTSEGLPRSLSLLDGMLSLLLIGGLRFSVRATENAQRQHKPTHPTGCTEQVLIAGAGYTGISILQEMLRNPQLGLSPVAFVDDDPEKLQLKVRGVPVMGNRHDIPALVQSLNINRLLIAMPTAPGSVMRELVETALSLGIRSSTVPGIHELFSGHVNLNTLRDIKIEDLLRREPIQTDTQAVMKFLKGKRVLVTGAGGSIGSELCRQILKCNPAAILLVGHGENSLFGIEKELKTLLAKALDLGITQAQPQIDVFVSDIRFISRLEEAFSAFHPDIVFHAAAHKHVPLMEQNSPEAITNNVMGTRNLLTLCQRYEVQHFVMISTDKAVNPTSIMGASKRIAEMLVLSAARQSGKPYAVVRFGNVLGSRGSVVPVFKDQIARGGPVTVTHPEICRYFMTIPEAVQLVLQAAVLGNGGKVFMLDMGQPVKIVDLAKDMIHLAGYEVDKDIQIEFTGLRPGEKIYEELFIPGEHYGPTEHTKIMTVRNASRVITDDVEFLVGAISQAALDNDDAKIRTLLKQLVPQYNPGGDLVEPSLADSIERPSETQHPNPETREFPPRSTSLPIAGLPTVALAADSPTADRLQNDLQQAFANKSFQIHYQPIVFMQTGRVIGFEALLRWQHPQLGWIPPLNFIPLLEETDLIIPIGDWILQEACRQIQGWQEEFPIEPALIINVNLASKQFWQPDLASRVGQILQETKLNASNLRLEVPGQAVIENPEAANTRLLELKALGVQLQIDNVEGGYSVSDVLQCSFDHHCYTQFDGISISRSLVGQLEGEAANLDDLQKMVSFAQTQGMNISATGVETLKQISLLSALNCEYGQGYFFSKPVKGDVAKALVMTQST